MSESLDGFLRHIRACNNTSLPEGRTPFLVAGQQIGWVDPRLAVPLQKRGLGTADTQFALPHGDAIEALAQELADEGLYRSHRELFDVIASPGAAALGRIDRGALPLFGLLAQGVHVNGLVERTDGLHLWVGHRAETKRLDPGKLDHLVAGGIPAGHTPDQALVKEAQEEASIPEYLALSATLQRPITYVMARPEGLRRDILHCYDLMLPETFTPTPADGEVAYFELMALNDVFRLVRDTDAFKFNVNLVLIDLFLRKGMIDSQFSDLIAGARHAS